MASLEEDRAFLLESAPMSYGVRPVDPRSPGRTSVQTGRDKYLHILILKMYSDHAIYATVR